MTVSLTTRLGLTRWSSDADAWSREQFDANFAALEDLAVIGTQGTNAARPAAGVARRLYVATDLERVYLDDGDEWYELLVGGVANASAVVFTPAGNIAATTVAGALAELDTEKATAAALTAHTGAAAGAHAATAISYAGSTNLSATTVEAALDELDAEKLGTGHTTASGAHTAANITNVPAGNIAAVTVQAALDELDSEKAPKASPTFTGTTTTATLAHGAGALLGFFGTAPVARPGTYNLSGAADRTLGAYASDPETAAYTGGPADLAAAAKVDDLNALRAAYENLRTYVEDLAGVVVGTATDLKTLGLVG